ncbi:hypothetical protein TanjilG_27693 [Lupinus angustifolius]|uniref:Uncharacterized protein n=1 Tax=Lupinus angustifolius TaxID=3871 RepID=A0A4P1RH03_LUPAN|nr:hypothetical protein TanjilG_27693 [Lupinus angustifolius]
MEGPLFDFCRPEPSQEPMVVTPPLDMKQAESSQQHDKMAALEINLPSEGHYGVTKFPFVILHPYFMSEIAKILNKICPGCKSIRRELQNKVYEGEVVLAEQADKSTLAAHQATDQGYINEPDVEWEKLNEVNGDTLFMTSNFKEFKVEESHESNTWDENNAMTSTENKDVGYVENQQQNIADAIDLLPRLATGIDVNLKFRRSVLLFI